MATSPETSPHKQKGWEHICTVIILIAEYGAVKYSLVWLAWTASLFLWFAITSYARHYLPLKSSKIVMLVSIPLIALGTYYITRVPSKPEMTAQAQTASQPQTSAQPQQPSEQSDKESKPVAKKQVPKSKPIVPKPPVQQDNSVHLENGSKLEMQSSGDCSPNIVGGSNTVNCGPPPPPTLSLKFSQERMASTDKKFAFETKVTITPNKEWSPVSLAIFFDGPPKKLDPDVEGARMLTEVGGNPSVDQNTWLVEIGSPATRPDRPVIALVFSDVPLRVLDVKPAKITNPLFPH